MTEKSIDNVNELKEKIKNLSVGQLMKSAKSIIDNNIDNIVLDEFSDTYTDFTEGYFEYEYEILTKLKEKKIKDILGEK